MRCFIALPLPAEARAALALAADRVRAAWPDLKWTRPEGYHMTLAFLGDIDGAAVECAKAAIDAASEANPFELSFEGIGGFPPHGPWRVLVGLVEDDGAAAVVHRIVNEALARHERAAGIPPLNPEWPDGRSFSPHVTIARAGRGDGDGATPGRASGPDRSRAHGGTPGPRDIEDLLGAAERRALSGSWTLDRCALFKSELRSSGAVYTELKSVILGAAANPLQEEED